MHEALALTQARIRVQAAAGSLGTLSPWFRQLLPRRLLEDGGRGELAAAVRPPPPSPDPLQTGTSCINHTACVVGRMWEVMTTRWHPC